jgi:hypothetical protein
MQEVISAATGNHTIGPSEAGRNYLLSGYRRQEKSGAPLQFIGKVRRTLTTAQDGPATDFQTIPQFLKKTVFSAKQSCSHSQ